MLLTLVAALALAQTPVLLGTFNNPAPEAGDFFGAGIVALGDDRVLVGAPNYIGNPTPPKLNVVDVIRSSSNLHSSF